jgi:large subunit ribosomal protein L25
MEIQELNVEIRTANGKGATRRLRETGALPAIVYGLKREPLSVSVDSRVFEKKLRDSGMGKNTVFRISGVEGAPTAMLKDLQVHPVSRSIRHVDLLAIDLNQEIMAEVPIRVMGRAKGIVAGGKLQQLRREVRVRGLPMLIPSEITVDVTSMDIGETLHVGELPYPEGVRPAMDEKLPMVTVATSRKSSDPAAPGDKPEASA